MLHDWVVLYLEYCYLIDGFDVLVSDDLWIASFDFTALFIGKRNVTLEICSGQKKVARMKSVKRSLQYSGLELKLDELRKELSSIHGGIFPHSILSSQQISALSDQKPNSMEEASFTSTLNVPFILSNPWETFISSRAFLCYTFLQDLFIHMFWLSFCSSSCINSSIPAWCVRVDCWLYSYNLYITTSSHVYSQSRILIHSILQFYTTISDSLKNWWWSL